MRQGIARSTDREARDDAGRFGVGEPSAVAGRFLFVAPPCHALWPPELPKHARAHDPARS
jgi:hypothetical protein